MHRSALLRAAVAFTAGAGLIGPAAAQSARYDTCLAAISDEPERARTEALQWARAGGGYAARHCAALALINLGAEIKAAQELTEIGAEGAGVGVPDRVGALMLAGDLWLKNGQTPLARETFARAALLAPEAAAPLIGSAKAASADDDAKTAAGFLNQALALDPTDPEALTLRAAAHRQLEDHAAALADALTATDLAPGAALAWFERGAAERALGGKDAARESWLIAIQLDPDGAAGELAQINLQRMELGLE